ncbi:MAG: sensor histidine kinase [Gammaproteobacteria bacterium]
MERNDKSGANGPAGPARPADDTTTENFFLPDLCGWNSIGVLALVAELLAIVLVLARSGLTADAWLDLAVTSLFVQWIALSSAAILCRLRKRLSTLQRNLAAVAAFGVIVADALVFSLAAQYIYGAAIGAANPATGPTTTTVVSHVLIAAIIGGLIMRYFYVQEQLRLQQEAELKARIQALQSRIRPHFLFNSMNIIASLIVTDPDTAESVVEDLSDLFRASLHDAGSEVTLAHELDLCRRYVRIEQLRLGSRLRVEWQLGDAPLAELRIPLLTLQPLLENAIYHGVQPLPEGGTVTVSVAYRDGQVRIEVENPVTEAPAETSHRGNRMAMDNIRHRLRAMYGPGAGIEGGRRGATYGTVLHYPFNIDRHGLALAQKRQEQQAGTRQ